jgi:hypothetical protein
VVYLPDDLEAEVAPLPEWLAAHAAGPGHRSSTQPASTAFSFVFEHPDARHRGPIPDTAGEESDQAEGRRPQRRVGARGVYGIRGAAS